MRELIQQCTNEEREAILAAAWIVARIGRVRGREREVLDAARRELGLSKETAARIAASRRGRRRPSAIDVPCGDAPRRVMFHYVVQVAGADGIIATSERQVSERLGGVLALAPTEVAAELDRFAAAAERRRDSPQYPSIQPDLADLVSLLIGMRSPEDGESGFGSPPLALQPLVIVATNLVPVLGVFFFDWDVATIMFLYWLENIVVGLFNVPKMWRERSVPSGGPSVKPSFWWFDIPFFIVHYGMFMTAHGLFIFSLFFKVKSMADFQEAMSGRWFPVIAALAALVVEHGCSFYFDFVRSESHRKPSSVPQMLNPYGRLAILHTTLIFGGIGVQELGSPRPALVLLVVLKTAVDLIAWAVAAHASGGLGRLKAAFARHRSRR